MGGQFPASAKAIIQTYVQTLPYTRAITAISTASPCFLTVSAHGFTVGQSVTIAGVTGGSFSAPINGTFNVTSVTTTTFAVGVNRISGGTTLGLTAASAVPAGGFPDLIRDRVRAIVHLLVTSPDFSIQK